MSALCRGIGKYLCGRKIIVWPVFKYIYSMNDQATDGVEFLHRGNDNYLAYRRTTSPFMAIDSSPSPGPPPSHLQSDHHREAVNNANGIMFLPGFLSNMNGKKALALEQFCKKSCYEFTRFDYQGCGESKGEVDMNNYVFDVWKEDALAVLDNLTTGPQMLVGSSMGGAIMLLLALERPERIHSLVAIAAPNYGKLLMSINTSLVDDKVETETSSSFNLATLIGQHNRDILASNSLAIQGPLRLIQGMQDEVVRYESALELARKVQSEDVRVILEKSATHDMSTPEGLELLLKTVQDLLNVNPRL